MKKTWVKRENIYFKPFYKQKTKMTLLAIFLLGIIFFSYQIFYINQLPNTSTSHSLESTYLPKENSLALDGVAGRNVATEEPIQIILRGIRLRDYDTYRYSFNGKFRCLTGDPAVEIDFDKVNDNYCDCLSDGSDEPSTNACANGKFYCKFQKRHITGRGLDVWIPSSRINDGICDCCDGSDEWVHTECKNKCR